MKTLKYGEIIKNRYVNLLHLIDNYRNMSIFAREINIALSTISLIVRQKRQLSDKLSRRIEQACQLEKGYMDLSINVNKLKEMQPTREITYQNPKTNNKEVINVNTNLLDDRKISSEKRTIRKAKTNNKVNNEKLEKIKPNKNKDLESMIIKVGNKNIKIYRTNQIEITLR